MGKVAGGGQTHLPHEAKLNPLNYQFFVLLFRVNESKQLAYCGSPGHKFPCAGHNQHKLSCVEHKLPCATHGISFCVCNN